MRLVEMMNRSRSEVGMALMAYSENNHAGWRLVRRDPCVYCCGRATSRDHIEPRHHRHPLVDNFAPACRECNGDKGSGKLLAFLARGSQKEVPRSHRANWRRVRNFLAREKSGWREKFLEGGQLSEMQLLRIPYWP